MFAEAADIQSRAISSLFFCHFLSHDRIVVGVDRARPERVARVGQAGSYIVLLGQLFKGQTVRGASWTEVKTSESSRKNK